MWLEIDNKVGMDNAHWNEKVSKRKNLSKWLKKKLHKILEQVALEVEGFKVKY